MSKLFPFQEQRKQKIRNCSFKPEGDQNRECSGTAGKRKSGLCRDRPPRSGASATESTARVTAASTAISQRTKREPRDCARGNLPNDGRTIATTEDWKGNRRCLCTQLLKGNQIEASLCRRYLPMLLSFRDICSRLFWKAAFVFLAETQRGSKARAFGLRYG